MEKSPMKKLKRGSVFEDFWTSDRDDFILSVDRICRGNDAGLINLKIKTCDAGEDWGIPFSSARCTVRTVSTKGHAFGRIFLKGYRILNEFIKSKTPPKTEKDKGLLEKLLEYLLDTDCQKALIDNVFKATGEPQLAEVLAENLFSPLSSSSLYTLDGQAQCALDRESLECDVLDGRQCKTFGNTNIGISNGWYGRLDILTGNADVGVTVHTKDRKNEGKVYTEENGYTPRFQIDVEAKDHIIAQTIVHSFFQRNRDKELQNYVIPSIAVSRDEIVFYFYDNECDILMQSSPLYMFYGRKVRTKVVIALWLVLNYKYLGTGFTRQMKEHKSGFFEIAEETIESYRNEVSLGKAISAVPMINAYSESVHNWSDEEK